MITEFLKHTHMTHLGQSRLAVFDDLLETNDLVNLHSALLQAGYAKSGYDRTDTFDARYWSTDISLDTAESMPIFGPTSSALESFRPENNYKLYAANINASCYGDMLYSHLDSELGDGKVTAAWYICEKWNHEWGGETLFFDEAKDARAVVMPRPGRLAIFDSDILHAERPPNRIYFYPRYTLTLKFESFSKNLIQ